MDESYYALLNQNRINIPMYRQGIEDMMKKGYKLYSVYCAEKGTGDTVKYDVLSKKKPDGSTRDIQSLAHGLFDYKYRREDKGLVFVVEDAEIDSIHTGNLFTLKRI